MPKEHTATVQSLLFPVYQIIHPMAQVLALEMVLFKKVSAVHMIMRKD